jgi:hypothetical protein
MFSGRLLCLARAALVFVPPTRADEKSEAVIKRVRKAAADARTLQADMVWSLAGGEKKGSASGPRKTGGAPEGRHALKSFPRSFPPFHPR